MKRIDEPVVHTRPYTLNPKPYTCYTLNSKPQALSPNPKLYILYTLTLATKP